MDDETLPPVDDETLAPEIDLENATDKELINAPAHGIQPGKAGAEADARHGLPTGTTPPRSDSDLIEPEPVMARDLDPETRIEADAADLKPDTLIEDG